MKKTTTLQNILGGAAFVAVALLSTQAIAMDENKSSASVLPAKKSDILQQVWEKHMTQSKEITDAWRASTEAAETKHNRELNECFAARPEIDRVGASISTMKAGTPEWEAAANKWESLRRENARKWEKAFDDYNHTIAHGQQVYGPAIKREDERFQAHLAQLRDM